MLPTHGRYPYSIIDRRPDYSWPNGKRLAFYVCLNIEYFAFGTGLGSDIGLGNPPPNHRGYAWRDYGNRVGLWRMLDMMDELGLPAAHNANSALYEHHPQIFERIRGRGDEVIGHGRTNSEKQVGMWEADERRLIGEATEIHQTLRRKPAEGMARAVAGRELDDTRSSEGSGIYLPIGLVVPRPAILDAHARGAHPERSVSAGGQRLSRYCLS